LYFSWRGNHRDSYLYTCLGINIYENNIQKEKFIKDVGFSMYDLYYQKAFACSNIGKINESMQLYVKILQEFDIQDLNKENILKKIRELPEPNHPIVSYTKQTMDKLKYQFPNCEEINENFSQIYQDIFVLSMNDGKKNGTYFEVGAGYPIKGNNTFLLETQFDWQGISIDIHPDSKDLFDKNRKNECICKDATSIDYIQLFSEHYKSTSIDYLQLDCDPANITYDILEKIPFDTYKFGVITYEHDFYIDLTGSYREKSRSFLKSKGYKLICGNISPLKDKYPFEDWWIHPDLIDENIWKPFERTDDVPINGEKYMLTKSKYIQNPIEEKAETIIDNKNVAFWDNQLCERGTTVAMYDYAYYNQTILGNKSYIFYDKNNPNNKKEIIEKFKKHFIVHETDDFKEVDEYLVKNNISHIYIIKSGELDSRLSKVAKNCVHCVFTCSQPHGEVYSSIAPWVQGNHNKYPVVPHMVNLPKNNNNMREKLNIPKNAIVFGGYGGKENFNIKFVQNVVCNIVQNNDNIYFLFANFHKFCQDLPNIIFLPMITNLHEKVEFINTCDAMLWAQKMGEVMSMSMGEFSTLNKPIICKDI
jgi:hypothetical protein